MNRKRIVITGIGAVSPFGAGVDALWNNVKAGNSGIKKITIFDTTEHLVKISGEFSDFNPVDYGIDFKEAKRMDRFTQFGIVASDEAIKDSGLNLSEIDPYSIGVMVSSAAGGFQVFEKGHLDMINKGVTKCPPFTIPMLVQNMVAGRIAIRHGLKGVNKAILSACASGTHSIGDAVRTIQNGDADIILAGATDAVICNLGIGAFTATRTLSRNNDNPEKASRPYDKDRDGFVMGEGAGVLILEEYEAAKKRGAKIYAEVIGYGQSEDAYDMVAPDPEGAGAEMAMRKAIKDAGIMPEDIDYINAHGTATGLGDIAESLAIERIFGNKDKNKNLKVSSTKSMLGHMLGASGAVEAIICIKAMENGVVPPTINLDNQDENVADLNYVPNVAQSGDINITMSNSFGFGGHNACIILKKVTA